MLLLLVTLLAGLLVKSKSATSPKATSSIPFTSEESSRVESTSSGHLMSTPTRDHDNVFDRSANATWNGTGQHLDESWADDTFLNGSNCIGPDVNDETTALEPTHDPASARMAQALVDFVKKIIAQLGYDVVYTLSPDDDPNRVITSPPNLPVDSDTETTTLPPTNDTTTTTEPPRTLPPEATTADSSDVPTTDEPTTAPPVTTESPTTIPDNPPSTSPAVVQYRMTPTMTSRGCNHANNNMHLLASRNADRIELPS